MRIVKLVCLAGALLVASLLYLNLSHTTRAGDCDSPIELESYNPQVKCISLIDDDLSFPRNLISLNDELWLVDKGTDLFSSGYAEGELYRYQPSGKGFVRETILDELLDPNDVAHRRDRNGHDWVYISTSTQVFRIRADLENVEQIIESRQVLIENIPTAGWHKLTAIELSQQSLWLTVPSATDHCELSENSKQVQYPCQEADTAQVDKATALIRRYDFDENDQLKPGFKIVARGLRDALAVAVNPQSSSNPAELLVADNGWDQIDLRAVGLDWQDHPADELNVIPSTQDNSAPHFGWPYCYDDNQQTPPYQSIIDSCDPYQVPWLLLPAHTAPLTMLYYQDKVLINLHASSAEAGRTIMFKLNSQGLPVAPYETLIDWAYTDSGGARGRPLGLAAGAKKELFISDDWHQRLMKVVLK